MSDVSLEIVVKSDGVSLATKRLADLAAQASKTGAALNGMAGGQRGLEAAFGRLAASAQRLLSDQAALAGGAAQLEGALGRVGQAAQAQAQAFQTWADVFGSIQGAIAGASGELGTLAQKQRPAIDAGNEQIEQLKAINGRLEEFAAKLKENDSLISYFAEHGWEMADTVMGLGSFISGTSEEILMMGESFSNSSVLIAKGSKMTVAATESASVSMTTLRREGASAASALLKSGMDLMPKILDGVTKAFNVLKVALLSNPFLMIAAAVAATVTALYAFRDANVTIGGQTAQVQDWIVGGWNVIKNGVGAVIDGIVKMFPGLGSGAKEAIGTVVKFFQDAGRFIFDLWKGYANGIIGTFVAMGRGGAEVGRQLVRLFTVSFRRIGELGIELGKGVAKAFTGDFSFDGFKKVLAAQAGDIKFAVDAIFGAVGSSYKDYIGGVLGASRQMLGQLTDTWKKETAAAAHRRKARADGDEEANLASTRAANANLRVSDTLGQATRAANDNAKALREETANLEATTAAATELAEAYRSKNKEAIARVEAKAKGDPVSVSGKLDPNHARRDAAALAVQAAAGAKLAYVTEQQTQALKYYNEEVASGELTLQQANFAKEHEAELGVLSAQAAAGNEDAQKRLRLEIVRLKDAFDALAVEQERPQLAAANKADEQRLAQMKYELTLIDMTARERAKALAAWVKEQEIRAKGGGQNSVITAEAQRQIQLAGQLAEAEYDLTAAKDAHNGSIEETIGLYQQMNASAQEAAQAISTGFGSVGKTIGDLLTTFTAYQVKQEEFAKRQKELADERVKIGEMGQGKDRHAKEMEQKSKEMALDREMAAARIQQYGDMIGAAKGFFKEGSSGYKVMQAAEKAYRLFQFAMSIQAMIQRGREAASTVASAGIEATANAGAGAAKIFSQLGAFGFPVVAAMVAALAALGLKGLKGGGGSVKVPTAEERQEKQGTGTILGDVEAKSESLQKALDLIAKNAAALPALNPMLRALRSIDTNIERMAAGLARQFAGGGVFDSSGLGLGSTGGKGILGALFGKSTTRTLNDLGLDLGSQSIGDILAGGLDGGTFQEVLVKTKKKFLGIGVGGGSRVETTTGALPDDLSGYVANLIGSMRSTIVEAAEVLGVDGAAAVLDAFTLNIGKISLKDMTGEEIAKELAAVFGKVGDEMALAVIPQLAEIQQVGEGTFETLARAVAEFAAVSSAVETLGLTFAASGIASLKARDDLVQAFGGLEQFSDAMSFLFENFMTEEQQIAAYKDKLSQAFGDLKIGGIETTQQFLALYQGLDLTTQQGREAAASLSAIAPMFLKVAQHTDKLNNSLGQTATTSAQAKAQLDAANAAVTTAFENLRSGFQAQVKQLQDTIDSSAEAIERDEYELSKAYYLEGERLAEELKAAGKAVDEARKRVEEARAEEAEAARQAARDRAQADLDDRQNALSTAKQGVQDAMSALTEAIDAELERYASKLEAASEGVSKARDRLSAAYDREKGKLEETISTLDELTGTLGDSLDELAQRAAGVGGPRSGYASARGRFESVSAAARGGDLTAAGELQDAVGGFLDASLATSRTSHDYLRDIARARSVVGATQAALGVQKSMAQQQLDALKAQVKGLLEIDEDVVAVADAVRTLQEALAGEAAAKQELEVQQKQLEALKGGEEATLSVAAAVANLQHAQDAEKNAQRAADDAQRIVDSLQETSRSSTSALQAALDALTSAEEDQALAKTAYDAVVNTGEYQARVTNELKQALIDEANPIKQATAQLARDQATHTDAVAELARIGDLVNGIAGLTEVTDTSIDGLVAVYNAALARQVIAEANHSTLLHNETSRVVAAIEQLNTAPATATPATTSTPANDNPAPNWSLYLARYPDVLAEYNEEATRDRQSRENLVAILGANHTAEDFARWHYFNIGQTGGYTPFATGGVFDRGGLVTAPTAFPMGLMGEAGPEAIMPLAMGPHGLGVRASVGSGGGGDAEDLRAMREELAQLRQAVAGLRAPLDRIDQSSKKLSTQFERVTSGGEAMITEAA